MNKMRAFAVAVCAVLVLALAGLAGCGGNTSASGSSASSGSTSASSAASSSASSAAASSATAGIANPWHEAANGAEAGEGAGFGEPLNVPDQLPIGDLKWIGAPRFSYMEGLAQADYDAGAVAATVRKGKDRTGEMLHGIYDEFPYTWEIASGDYTVACKGNENGVANLMEWSANGFNYSLYIIGTGGENYGVSGSDVIDTVMEIS